MIEMIKNLVKKRFRPVYLLYHRIRFRIMRRLIADEKYVTRKFIQILDRVPNLKSPVTYNEHISKKLLHYNDPLAAKCVDKYLVREYVEEKIGPHVLNDLYGIYRSTKQIKNDLDHLPRSFVLKATHGSGWNYICRDKQEMNWRELEVDLHHWLKSNFYSINREKIYRELKPGIVCERYLEDGSGGLTDYKVDCFHGQPAFITVITDRFGHLKQYLYDTEWNFLAPCFNRSFCNEKGPVIEKPLKLQELLSYSRILSQDFPHVRCDFYIVGNKVIFGELTFTPANGADLLSIDEDRFLGSYFNQIKAQ